MSFEEAKQHLRAQPADGGPSLYDHLSQVLLKVVTEKATDVNFEELSAAVRAMSLAKQQEPKESTAEPSAPPPAETPDPPSEEGAEPKEPAAETKPLIELTPEKRAQLGWVAKQAPLFVPPTEDAPDEAAVPDLMAQAAMWEWAGVSFGREATYRLFLSLKQLAATQGAAFRFWGKLITRAGDYYVAETRTAENPAEGDQRFEMEGSEGPNKYTYWASMDPSDAASWRQLPHVTPKQIVVARKIRRLLTGDLDAAVPSFPPFPGNKEENLVRAMIAQITADTVLSLNGTLTLDEEAEEDMKVIGPVDEEEAAGLSFSLDDLKDQSTWIHAELDINAVGRTQKTPLPLNEEGEPIEPEEEDAEPLAPLRSIGEDTVGESEKPLWVLRTCPSGAGQSPHSLVFAKSLKWPGAFSVASGKTVTNVYAGFGVSTSPIPAPYEPPLPAQIHAEWAPPEDEEDKALNEQEDVTVEPPKEEEEE